MVFNFSLFFAINFDERCEILIIVRFFMEKIPGKDVVEFSSDHNPLQYINFKLASMGKPYFYSLKPDHGVGEGESGEISTKNFIDIAGNLIQNYSERNRLLKDYLCAADRRINSFLQRYFDGIGEDIVNIPTGTFVLDRYGLARQMSLPPDRNEFINPYIESYRIKQGVLHNPRHDRRTTVGTFHIVADGLPVPADKKEVPRIAFARLLKAACNPPDELLTLPFTSSQEDQAKIFASVYLKPLVSPEVPCVMPEKRMEIRFFAPSSLISNIDFVESIFGNAGDPGLIENDSALDVEKWSGHTGCIILAPHLTGSLTKKELGLPHYDDATARQRKDGMCWKDDKELYNDGVPFKITCRNSDGVVVTLIGDNYFGYSKKEIKTQISFASNLLGLSEEEHAGGALVFPRRSLGEHYYADIKNYKFEDVKKSYSEIMNIYPDNYGVDKKFPNVIYIPEKSDISLYKQEISWEFKGEKKSIKLLPERKYILPDGSKVHMEKHPSAPVWRLIGTHPLGTFCHKPFTVSGGGKSEISKSLLNSVIYDTFYINNLKEDFDHVEQIINYDYKNRWEKDKDRTRASRSFLSPRRSVGSVIKLLTPSVLYTEEYNGFLNSFPNRIKALALYIKRFYRPEWGDEWRKYFSVRIINGKEGNALHFNGRKITASYLRVGFAPDDMWYIHKLRTDFIASEKLQQEDDISVSVTLGADKLKGISEDFKDSVKMIKNCEFRLFQRPDEAIHRGYDIEAEKDLADNNNFISNYEPLTSDNAQELIESAISFEEYTEPIKKIIKDGADGGEGSWFIAPSHPRVLPSGRSTNPRYLQTRPDITDPELYYRGEIGQRLFKKIPLNEPCYTPVDAVLPSRRNNPPDKAKGIKGLSVYNPIHYQELPELFMDFICSLSGKSPSTTGAGSEGALTKGPFNMLSPVTDLNNALLSFILTGYAGYTSVAGWVGSETRFDHDISILIPEIWSRLSPDERKPEKLIAEGSLEKVEDLEWKGEKVLTSRLGYRITENFLFNYLGRIFDEPLAVFNKDMLRPERQDIDGFIEGMNQIVDAQKKVAKIYFEDGSVEGAIPPLKALLHIMANDFYDGKDINDPDIRKLFDRDYVVNSDWYKDRLKRKQDRDIAHYKKIISYLEDFMSKKKNSELAEKLEMDVKLKKARAALKEASSREYLKLLEGTIGLDPVYGMEE